MVPHGIESMKGLELEIDEAFASDELNRSIHGENKEAFDKSFQAIKKTISSFYKQAVNLTIKVGKWTTPPDDVVRYAKELREKANAYNKAAAAFGVDVKKQSAVSMESIRAEFQSQNLVMPKGCNVVFFFAKCRELILFRLFADAFTFMASAEEVLKLDQKDVDLAMERALEEALQLLVGACANATSLSEVNDVIRFLEMFVE